MKKVLILAYDFPPYISAGSFRPYSWYKYLHEFGIYPIIVTRQWNNKYGNHLDYIAPSDSSQTVIEKSENGTIIRTPYVPNLSNRLLLNYGESKFKLFRKFITAYYEFIQYLFLIGPKSKLYFAAKEYLKTNKTDVIIATGNPFILFKYASILSKRFNIPWLADYRDPWSNDVSIQENYFLKTWYANLEKRITNSALFMTTTIGFFKFQIENIIKNKPVYIINNGYDPELFDHLTEIKQQSDILNIAFAGTIEKWHPIRSFLEVISSFQLNNIDSKIKVNFYGINIPSILNEMLSTEYPDIKQNVEIFPKMVHNLLLRELAKNNLMLLFNSYYHTGTKIYDYLGIKRTILLCYSNNEEARNLKDKFYRVKGAKNLNDHVQEDLINETNSGYVVKDRMHLSFLLGKLYGEFMKNGYIRCNTINAEKYSRKRQTQNLAELIISSHEK